MMRASEPARAFCATLRSDGRDSDCVLQKCVYSSA
eukprot:COSAG04_NODE_13132_length_619_cov_0.596154_2_plen_34_part_01